MKRYLAIFSLVFLLGCHDNPKEKKVIYYFYDAKTMFKISEITNDSLHYLNYEKTIDIGTVPNAIGGDVNVYGFIHYYKFRNYKTDTIFIKHKSYLDSIKYIGNEWLKNKDNLDKFWNGSRYGELDSLIIFVIQPIDGTDSLLFRRVHRYFEWLGG